MTKAITESDDLALGIARAIIRASTTPLLLLDQSLTIIAASMSFCRAFGTGPVAEIRLHDVGAGEWNVPQLTALLLASATGPVAVENYGMTLKRPGQPDRQLVINAHRVDHSAGNRILILLSIADNTENLALEKQRADLLKEKEILLEELQHRVANSLQIIASVLLQSARGVPAGDSRVHIFDAHSRVMSVATLQHQLALSPRETVTLRVYFSNLCRSIGASMMPADGRVRIVVDVDDSKVAAGVSLCRGLMLTELVINALKHAYPDGRGGVIRVVFRSDAGDWSLTVKDDGMGMLPGLTEPKAGLGSSIVQALAAQVDARITVTDAGPGTAVTIRHCGAVAATRTTLPV